MFFSQLCFLCSVQFTDEEKDQLRRLPNKDYILENKIMKMCSVIVLLLSQSIFKVVFNFGCKCRIVLHFDFPPQKFILSCF